MIYWNGNYRLRGPVLPGNETVSLRVTVWFPVFADGVKYFSLQAKAEGWMDRERLNAQFASVRDGAADLLEQLAGGATKASSGRGRSGGVVDAPGKKHRKPLPPDPGARMVDSQAAKLRTATTMVKTNRRRGRG